MLLCTVAGVLTLSAISFDRWHHLLILGIKYTWHQVQGIKYKVSRRNGSRYEIQIWPLFHCNCAVAPKIRNLYTKRIHKCSTSLNAIFLCWNIDNVNNHHTDQHKDYLVHCQVHGCNLPIKDQSDTKKSKVKIFKKYNHWLLIFESSIFFSNMIFWIQSFGFFLQNALFHHESLRLDDFHTFHTFD